MPVAVVAFDIALTYDLLSFTRLFHNSVDSLPLNCERKNSFTFILFSVATALSSSGILYSDSSSGSDSTAATVAASAALCLSVST